MSLFDVPDGQPEEFYEELPSDPVSEAQARSSLHGKEFDQEAFEFIETAGGRVLHRYPYVLGYRLDALIQGANGHLFYLYAHGTPDRTDRPQAGLRRQDTVMKLGFKAMRLRDRQCPHPLLVLTSHLPSAETRSAFLLSELRDAIFDAIATVGDLAGFQRLRDYLTAVPALGRPLEAPWRSSQLNIGEAVATKNTPNA